MLFGSPSDRLGFGPCEERFLLDSNCFTNTSLTPLLLEELLLQVGLVIYYSLRCCLLLCCLLPLIATLLVANVELEKTATQRKLATKEAKRILN